MTSTAMQCATTPANDPLPPGSAIGNSQHAGLPGGFGHAIAPASELAFAYQLMEMLAVPAFVLDRSGTAPANA